MKATRDHIGRIFLQLLLFRLFTPTLILILAACATIGHLWYRDSGTRQLQLARSLAHTADSYIVNAGRVLKSVSKAADSDPSSLLQYMTATWSSYGYFDTLYRLDDTGRVLQLVPFEERYVDLDLSNQKYFEATSHSSEIYISKPFSSLRTNRPTVFVAFALEDDGIMVGELNLTALQDAIQAAKGAGHREVFVVDTNGLLLAHPDPALVAQQTNMGHLEVIRSGKKNETTIRFTDDGEIMLGSVAHVQSTGWMVVVMAPFYEVFGDTLQIAIPVLIIIFVVWSTLVWTFRRQFNRVVIAPLSHLASTAERISKGDMSQEYHGTDRHDEIGALAGTLAFMTSRLKRRVEIGETLSELSRRFIECSPDEMDSVVDDCLHEFGEFTNANRSFLFQRSDDGGALSNTHEWCREGAASAIHRLQDLKSDDFPWLMSRLEGHHTVIDSDASPHEAGDELKSISSGTTASLAVFPVHYNQRLWGFLGFEKSERGETFTDDLQLLSVLGEVICNAVERHKVGRALSWELEVNSSLATLSQALVSSISTDDMSFLVLEHAQRLTASEHGFVGYVDPKTGHLVIPTLSRTIWEQCRVQDKDIVFSDFCGLWGWVLNEHRTLVTNAPSADERSVGVPGGHLPITRFASVPSMFDGKLVGQIAVSNAPRDYEQEDVDLLERLAVIYAAALMRSRSEEELADMNRHLEHLVETRTQDLAAKAAELEKANRRLLEIDEMKTAFLTSVSHEIRTPLTSVLGFAKLIARDFRKYFNENDQERKGISQRILNNLEIVEHESMRLTRLINDVLDISKIEAGRMEWNDRDVLLEDVISSAINAVSGLFANRDVTLKRDVQLDSISMHVDPDRLIQVLINLLDNAFKYTLEGEVLLQAKRLNGRIRVSVKDTGVGLGQEDWGRVFDKFQQISNNDTVSGHRPTGTGLGLAICKQIIEHYNGRIWVESLPGQGATFHFELPQDVVVDPEGS